MAVRHKKMELTDKIQQHIFIAKQSDETFTDLNDCEEDFQKAFMDAWKVYIYIYTRKECVYIFSSLWCKIGY